MTARSAGNNARQPRRHPLAVAIALAFAGSTASAETFNPTTTEALISAISNANSNNEADTINLAGGRFALTRFFTLDGQNGLPSISSDIAITGEGATIEADANAASPLRIFHVAENGKLTLSDVTLRGGAAEDTIPFNGVDQDEYGGAIFNKGTTIISGSTISGNSATSKGGGIYNQGVMTITDSDISGNTADSNGGGIFNAGGTMTIDGTTISGNTAGGRSAGVYAAGGTMTITDSTISGNTATLNGGGVYNLNADITLSGSTISGNVGFSGAGIMGSGNLKLSNTTISGNTANRYGGGIYNGFNDNVTITNSTISGNSAAIGGGIFNQSGSTLSLNNSVLANSLNSNDCYSAPDTTIGVFNSLIENNYNCQFDIFNTTILGQDPQLSELRNNGGPTETHLPRPDGPLIDAGDNNLADGLNTDQRGLERFVGTVDIGAVERQSPEPAEFIFDDQFEEQ